jgi:hypothetical protein
VLYFVAAFVVGSSSALAQKVYSITLPLEEKKIIRGHLDLGGVSNSGDSIAVNSYYIEMNGRPFFPVIGEFHYSRYPYEYWEESLLKMKAGGINVLATYVFWNIHERKEGQFDWSGNLDLRKFISLCKKLDFPVILRIGPFGHGEMRNGALPDWLYGRPFEVRSNDEGYLHYVRKLYAEIGKQVEGLFFKDGGPIIGIQLENEYQHSAAPWEITYPGAAKEYTVARRDLNVTHAGVSVSHRKNEYAEYGTDHMQTLKKLAQEAGMVAPLYTATGWGNAAIVQKGSIPVTAGYAYPFWEPIAKPSPFYLYKDIHKNPDYAPVSYEPELYPSLPAELGPGIQITYSRRPTVPPQSVEAMMIRTIGSGSNGIGYYMYHGGSTPVFEHFYSEESGGIPKISYDFQAPIGEYGDTRLHYNSQRMLHHFLKSYGELLAPMQTVLPEGNASIKPDDVTTLRYAVRAKGNSGFVFMHNFQDHLDYVDINDVAISIRAANETIRIPATGYFDLRKGVSTILPFNLAVEGELLKYATVSPLTILRSERGNRYVFVSNDGLDPEFLFEGSVKVKSAKAKSLSVAGGTKVTGPFQSTFSFTIGSTEYLVIPKSMAMKAYVHGDRLFLTDANLLFTENGIELISRGQENVHLDIYPRGKFNLSAPGTTVTSVKSSEFSSFNISFKKVDIEHEFRKVDERKYLLKSGLDFGDLNDVFVRIDYQGDRAMAFYNGLLIADHFYYGQPWTIGLKRFKTRLDSGDILFMFHPMQKDATYLVDLPEDKVPDFSASPSLLKVNGVTFVPEYKAMVRID